jgi:hypothetical protein
VAATATEQITKIAVLSAEVDLSRATKSSIGMTLSTRETDLMKRPEISAGFTQSDADSLAICRDAVRRSWALLERIKRGDQARYSSRSSVDTGFKRDAEQRR